MEYWRNGTPGRRVQLSPMSGEARRWEPEDAELARIFDAVPDAQ